MMDCYAHVRWALRCLRMIVREFSKDHHWRDRIILDLFVSCDLPSTADGTILLWRMANVDHLWENPCLFMWSWWKRGLSVLWLLIKLVSWLFLCAYRFMCLKNLKGSLNVSQGLSLFFRDCPFYCYWDCCCFERNFRDTLRHLHQHWLLVLSTNSK